MALSTAGSALKAARALKTPEHTLVLRGDSLLIDGETSSFNFIRRGKLLIGNFGGTNLRRSDWYV